MAAMAALPNTERVALRHVGLERAWVRLREPQAGDELALNGVDTRAAVGLLDRLMDTPPCSAGALSASDRDALLCALHRGLWGDRIVSSLTCRACGALYDLSFTLSAMQWQLAQAGDAAVVEAPRVLVDGQGQRYRLPDAAEEEGAAQLGSDAGRAALREAVQGTDPLRTDDIPAVSARLEALAPIIDVDLDAACAECGQAQQARFDIQSFVLQRLLDERDGLRGEVHALASGYGWPLHDIVSLPRSLRRSLVQRLTGMPAAGAWN